MFASRGSFFAYQTLVSSRSTVAAIGESPSYVISGVHMLYAKLSSHFILVRSEYIHDLMKYIRGGGTCTCTVSG